MNKLSRNSAIGTLLTLGLVVTVSACSASSPSTVASDCKPAHDFSTIEKGKLTVGVTEIPPYSYTKDGSPTGADVAIIKNFAAANCLAVKYVPVTYSAAVPAVQNKRIDLTIGDWYRTEARTKIVDLSAPIYLDEIGVVSKDGITNVNDLKNKKVGTVDGYLFVPDLKAMIGTDHLSVYPSSVELKQDLEAGRVEAGVDAYGTALFNFPKGSSYKVTTVKPDPQIAATVKPAQTTFPHTKDNTAMGLALDANILELRKSGELVKILEANGLPATAAEVGEARLGG